VAVAEAVETCDHISASHGGFVAAVPACCLLAMPAGGTRPIDRKTLRHVHRSSHTLTEHALHLGDAGWGDAHGAGDLAPAEGGSEEGGSEEGGSEEGGSEEDGSEGNLGVALVDGGPERRYDEGDGFSLWGGIWSDLGKEVEAAGVVAESFSRASGRGAWVPLFLGILAFCLREMPWPGISVGCRSLLGPVRNGRPTCRDDVGSPSVLRSQSRSPQGPAQRPAGACPHALLQAPQ